MQTILKSQNHVSFQGIVDYMVCVYELMLNTISIDVAVT